VHLPHTLPQVHNVVLGHSRPSPLSSLIFSLAVAIDGWTGGSPLWLSWQCPRVPHAHVRAGPEVSHSNQVAALMRVETVALSCDV
jgi:hypothetical protein